MDAGEAFELHAMNAGRRVDAIKLGWQTFQKLRTWRHRYGIHSALSRSPLKNSAKTSKMVLIWRAKNGVDAKMTF